MDWPTTVLGLGVCALIAFLSGNLPKLLQDIGDTVPIADLRPEPPLPDPIAQRREVQAIEGEYQQRIRVMEIAVTRSYDHGYDKGYHDASQGLPKDPNNGRGVITVEQTDTLRRMRESKWFREHEARWTGDTRG